MAIILKEILPVYVWWVKVPKPCIIQPSRAAYVELQLGMDGDEFPIRSLQAKRNLVFLFAVLNHPMQYNSEHFDQLVEYVARLA